MRSCKDERNLGEAKMIFTDHFTFYVYASLTLTQCVQQNIYINSMFCWMSLPETGKQKEQNENNR